MNTTSSVGEQAGPKPPRKWLRIVKWFVAILLIPVLGISLLAIYFHLFVKEGNRFDKTEHKVKLEVLLDTQISNAEWEQKIRKWIAFAADRLDEAANVRITIERADWLVLTPEDSGTYDYEKSMEFNTRIQSERQSADTICLAYLYGNVNTGRAFMADANIVCFYNERTDERAKWVLLHEFAHLFGAIHVAPHNCVMDRVGFWDEIETLQFDERNKEILNLAREDVMAKNATTFRLRNAALPYGERIVQQMKAILTQDDSSRIWDRHKIAGYHFLNKQYESALAEWKIAYKACLSTETGTQSEDVTDSDPLAEPNFVAPPPPAQLAYYLGICLMELGRHSEAVGYLLTASEHEPMNFKYNNALAVCYGHIDEVESALEVFERCGQIGTEDGEFWYNYSLTLLKGIPYSIWDGERIERAKECFGKAIEYEQEELICYLALAGILQHQGFQEESKAHLAKAEELGANLNLAFQKKGGTFQAPQYGATTPIALPDEWK